MTATRRRSSSPSFTTFCDSERWRTFVGFWVGATIMFLILGVAVFMAAHNGHRLGIALVALAFGSLAIALTASRAARRG